MSYARLCKLSCQSSATAFSSVRALSTSSEYKVPGTEKFFKKQAVYGRPLSPHLTIYKPQLTSMLSISHRGSGVGYAVLLYGGTLLTVLPNGFSHYVALAEQFAPGDGIMTALKTIVVLPFMYHTFNGFRHLAWDTGRGFKIADLYKSGWFTVAISVVSSLLMALFL